MIAWIDETEVEFLPTDRELVERRFNHPVITARSRNPEQCEAVAELMHDSLVWQVFGEYFGYSPGSVHAKLMWSFVCEASLESRLRAKQALRYHYDLHASAYVGFNFYLTDVDKYSGAHVLVRGSHGRKRLSEILSRTGRSDEYIEARYGPDRVETLLGPAGSGFVEDHFCYHKATIPLRHDRLILMLHVS